MYGVKEKRDLKSNGGENLEVRRLDLPFIPQQGALPVKLTPSCPDATNLRVFQSKLEINSDGFYLFIFL